jgi:hypothetical protein
MSTICDHGSGDQQVIRIWKTRNAYITAHNFISRRQVCPYHDVSQRVFSEMLLDLGFPLLEEESRDDDETCGGQIDFVDFRLGSVIGDRRAIAARFLVPSVLEVEWRVRRKVFEEIWVEERMRVRWVVVAYPCGACRQMSVHRKY